MLNANVEMGTTSLAPDHRAATTNAARLSKSAKENMFTTAVSVQGIRAFGASTENLYAPDDRHLNRALELLKADDRLT